MQPDSDFLIPHEQVDAAIKFGVEQIDAADVKQYIVAFMRKLLLQREKIDKDVLTNYLIPVITKQWQEMLSSLEESNRKLINIQSGSLTFKLFCPTKNSVQQIQDDKSKIELQEKMKKLLNTLGMF